MMSLMGSGGNFSPLPTMPQLPAGIQIPTHPQFPPNDDPTGIDYGFGMGMGMGIPTNHSGLLNYPYAMESPVSGLSATSSSSRRLVPEPAHSSIQNYPGDYVIPPWHGISFPTSVSQCTTSPAQGTTPAGVLPSQLLDNVARESRSSHSGSSERDTSSSIAKFQGYP
ncbi:PREDICTED: uncharacterized protein LOC105951216 [Erythranthe guttata]|uniref:uncharacterized protein LOC105951216 n=1 Tax=Erythranthe guttata TaxID=4155 RepID=UPI00064E0EF0|nr:PREDICTED: uncharacterized protein LOC105951216 [Erythranthe guttata]|eukprot:XP_012830057.1 PREDICTED: uncharacterized protein LOC105951216 [Erythranthe guttata]